MSIDEFMAGGFLEAAPGGAGADSEDGGSDDGECGLQQQLL